jgi:superfamily II DNA/RNA helicase
MSNFYCYYSDSDLKGYEFLIANPSRLLDLVNQEEENKIIDLKNVTYLIVDEYIQFRKSQTMDQVKAVVDLLRVIILNTCLSWLF